MSRSLHRLSVPATLTVSIIGLVGCPQPVAPGACVSNFVPPAGATAPPAGVQPQIDIAPCADRRIGLDWNCTTASGCQVGYVGGTNAVAGAPVAFVSCPTTDQCLWGIDSHGIRVLGSCPRLDVQPQHCQNTFRMDDPTRSYFACSSDLNGCTLNGGGVGHQSALVMREVTGGVDSTPCPTPCTPFA